VIHELGSPWDVVKASYLRIEEDIKTKVFKFDGSLTSYKRKLLSPALFHFQGIEQSLSLLHEAKNTLQ